MDDTEAALERLEKRVNPKAWPEFDADLSTIRQALRERDERIAKHLDARDTIERLLRAKDEAQGRIEKLEAELAKADEALGRVPYEVVLKMNAEWDTKEGHELNPT
jgi:predicted nuclease with TOPRIM domain